MDPNEPAKGSETNTPNVVQFQLRRFESLMVIRNIDIQILRHSFEMR